MKKMKYDRPPHTDEFTVGALIVLGCAVGALMVMIWASVRALYA